MNFVKKLLEFDIFKGISEQTKEKMETWPVVSRDYEAEELISFFGDPITYIYFVTKGTLKTNEYSVEGKEIVSSYYPKGSVFPFYLVYSGARNFPYNVTCFKNARVIQVPVECLQEAIANDPHLMLNILKFVSEYCNYNKRVIRTTIYPRVRQRLAFWLLTSSCDDGKVIMPGTQAVFADILQTNRSTLNQELQKLKEEGAIQVKGSNVTIKDFDLLEEIIGNA